MRVHSKTISFVGKVFLFGLMEGSIMDNGKMGKWMGKGYLLGQMGKNILESIQIITKTDLGDSLANLKFMKEIGKKASLMEKVK